MLCTAARRANSSAHEQGGMLRRGVKQRRIAFDKQLDRTVILHSGFVEQLAAANQRQIRFFNRELPLAIQALEVLETQRLNFLRSQLVTLARLRQDFVRPLSSLETLHQVSGLSLSCSPPPNVMCAR